MPTVRIQKAIDSVPSAFDAFGYILLNLFNDVLEFRKHGCSKGCS